MITEDQLQIISSNEEPQQVAANKRKSHRMFLDDTEYTCFVRRLSWSPDGTFMLTPSSWYQDLSRDLSQAGESKEKFQYTVYGFMKSSVNKASFMLPGIKTHANCIRFCPLLLQLQPDLNSDENPALIDLPYRLVFAVATIDNVLIYTTQSIHPLMVIKNLHYDSINDLSWMNHKMLMVASSDGYCSFIKMDPSLIGEPLPPTSELIPEALVEHYTTLSGVNFDQKVS